MAECSVDGCTRLPRSKKSGLCNAHYFQQYRNGHITSAVIHEYGTTGCKEPECDKPHKTLGWCEMHYIRWRRHGDPQIVLPTCADMPSALGPDHPAWKGDDIGYRAVHMRLRGERGPAPEYTCAHCGSQAKQWSYDHTDPNERTAREGPYSTDLARYRPLCVPCHKMFDIHLDDE